LDRRPRAPPARRAAGARRRSLGDRGIRFHLGASGDDTVFRRSFSLLVLAIVLVADKERRFLGESEFREVPTGSSGTARASATSEALCPVAAGRTRSPTRPTSRTSVQRAASAGPRSASGCCPPSTGSSRAVEVFQAEEDERIGIAFAALRP
jgi:hypothetical protein